MTTKIKVGDLTLKQLREILDRSCPWSCKECREKHSADYIICNADFEFNFEDSLLDQDIEVEYDEIK